MGKLPHMMAWLTGKVRAPQEIWWRSESLVHNAFMLWKLIFWARDGIRCESSVATDGVTEIHRYYTWEALFFAAEYAILHPGFRVPIKVHIPILQTTLGIPFFASPYIFAIIFDASGNASGTSPSCTVTTGSGSSNYLGIAHVLPFAAAVTTSAATWAGASMTVQYDTTTNTLDGAGAHTYLYSKVAPASGAQTVAVTSSGNCGLQALTYSGVDQTSPFDPNFGGAGVKFVENQTLAVTNNAEITVTGTSHVDGSLGTAIAEGSVASSPGTNTITRLAVQFFSFEEAAPTSPAGSMSMANKNISGGLQNLFIGMLAMQPAAGGTTANNLSLLGVGT